MAGVTPNPKKRSYLLPPGCKDLIHLLNGAPSQPSLGLAKVNGKIRASQVRVVGEDGSQLGIMKLADALALAESLNIDLVEIAPHASSPVCRLIDYGKYRAQAAKRKKRRKQ